MQDESIKWGNPNNNKDSLYSSVLDLNQKQNEKKKVN